jgi:hypothetical protein
MTISHVDEHDNYEFLPINIGNVITAVGSTIEFNGHSLFANFFKNFKDNLEYQVYLENCPNCTAVFAGKNKNKILGAIFKVGNGNLVTLPCLLYNEDDFIEEKTNSKGIVKSYWNQKSLIFSEKLISCLIEIDKGLTSDTIKTPAPSWVLDKKFSSEKEIQIQKSINVNIDNIKKIEQKNKNLQAELQDEQLLKDLLYEQGKPLENSVIKALNLLGFQAENFDNGELELDQVIISPEGYRYVGECEGKNEKDIDITKFRQLLESLNADFAREEVKEKAFGILFGNAQRLLEPEKRTLNFTQKCKVGADREKIALIQTTDLFKVAKFLNNNLDETFQKKCRDAVYDCLGKVVIFPDLPPVKK